MVLDADSLQPLGGKCATEKREIASLTKIFTLYVACCIISEVGLDPKTHKVTIGYAAEAKSGTSADLEPGDNVSLHDLLYGLMLPSGNDAAIAIAGAVGSIIHTHRGEEGSEEANPRKSTVQSARKLFLKEMNSMCTFFALKDTNFQNSHGLTNTQNRSTPSDIATMFAHGLKHFALFRQVVTTK